MHAVGRIGSYISKSVYTVSGPFHPFGGAVDIIVVEQPDGSYKSSPWYVRFGKFQGVLKSKEKIVSISVNGVDADFHMYLDHKGEAFFMTEVDVEETESASSPPSSSGEDMDGQLRNRWALKSKSCNFDSNWSESIGSERKAVTRANSRRSPFLGLVFGRRSASEEGVQMKEDPSGFVRTESLELAEFAADLLDLKWSTNLASSRTKKDSASLLSAADTLKDRVSETRPVDDSSHDETGHISQTSYQEVESSVETKCVTTEYIVKKTTSVESVRKDTALPNSEPLMTDTCKSDLHVSSVSIISEVATCDSQVQDSIEKLNGLSEDQFSFIHEEKMSVSGGTMNGTPESILTECYSQLVCLHQSNDSPEGIDSQSNMAASSLRYSTCSSADEQNVSGQKDKHESPEGPLFDPQSGNSLPPCTEASRIAEEELLLFGDLDGLGSTNAKHLELSQSDHEGKDVDSLFSSRVADGVNESSDAKCCSRFSLDQSVINDYLNDGGLRRKGLCSVSSDAHINETGHDHSKGLTRMARSLPCMGPLSSNFEATDGVHSAYPSPYPGASSGADMSHQSPGVQTTTENVKNLKESKEKPAKPSLGSPRSVETSWPFPFRRSRGMRTSHVEVNGSDNPNVVETPNNSSDLERGTKMTKVKVVKKKVRTLTPTSEQLALLNLKEGKNVVIFTFSTAMLGKQQVDARIFLWRWDTQIVISDVDGTITRSDLLGQVMPLVGMDWSQTGVAHLFSAIKENGYQLLFLSARSISQSFITRQFLFSIKQDGKALPDGPVVISPDGLFPSLFREVVRRAPHEFKIACLEDIKALFPPDRNPFYAGFGNRDTDEFSYLKVGIPMGKIFIINPKGEIAVNRRVDTKSYLALHALVHGMFPTMSTCEQEDFNSWNYWKVPPPVVDI